MEGVEIHPVPALSDNYMYLIIDAATRQAAVVDPVEPLKLMNEASRRGLQITAVLTTHSHGDHDGGNHHIRQLLPSVPVYGGRGDGVAGVTREVGDGEVIQVGGLHFTALLTPGHTPAHICYYLQAPRLRAVFTGDCMFVGGCGNFHVGPASLFHASFMKLNALPDDTLLYVGHEYTVQNLKYALFVEPTNPAVRAVLQQAEERQRRQQPTVPSTIGDQREINPFLRAAVGVPTILNHCKTSDVVAAFQFIRQEKSAGAWKAHVH